MKKYYCLDCKKEIHRTSIRCHSCSKKGQLHPRFIGKPHCIDCGIEIYWNSKRCKKCNFKYKKLNIKKTYCLDCKQEISRLDANRCKVCSNKFFGKERIKNRNFCGTNNPNYKDGSAGIYPIDFNDSLKESIRKRDNYECQNCSMTEEEHLIVIGKVLHVHHINYNKQNCNEENLITLCNQCNTRANSNRDYWQKIYKEKIQIILTKNGGITKNVRI
jgi:DNA-directed RNA polymerase subunit RPC12/RpoP